MQEEKAKSLAVLFSADDDSRCIDAVQTRCRQLELLFCGNAESVRMFVVCLHSAGITVWVHNTRCQRKATFQNGLNIVEWIAVYYPALVLCTF